jgi:hypothetical protein
MLAAHFLDEVYSCFKKEGVNQGIFSNLEFTTIVRNSFFIMAMDKIN